MRQAESGESGTLVSSTRWRHRAAPPPRATPSSAAVAAQRRPRIASCCGASCDCRSSMKSRPPLRLAEDDRAFATRLARYVVRNGEGPTAALLQQIFEVDPLACPTCHGAMRLVAFMTQASVIDQLLAHLRTRTAREAHAAPRSPAITRGDVRRARLCRWHVRGVPDGLGHPRCRRSCPTFLRRSRCPSEIDGTPPPATRRWRGRRSCRMLDR